MTLTSRRKGPAGVFPLSPSFLFFSVEIRNEAEHEREVNAPYRRYPKMERRVGRRPCGRLRDPVATVQDQVSELATI